jgi:hypothetical protein
MKTVFVCFCLFLFVFFDVLKRLKPFCKPFSAYESGEIGDGEIVA